MAPKKSQPPAKGPLPRANLLPPLGTLSPPRAVSAHRRRYYLHFFAGVNRRYPPAVHLRSPIPSNVCRHEGGTGKAASSVRPRWERAKQDREHAAREQKEMKHLNNHLLAQIAVLQNTRVPPPSPERPSALEAISGERLKVGGIAEQPPPLHWNNPTMSQVLLIPIQRINLVSLEEGLRHSSVSKISISSHKSESKKRVCLTTVNLGLSLLMHLILPSPRPYWNINFPRSS